MGPGKARQGRAELTYEDVTLVEAERAFEALLCSTALLLCYGLPTKVELLT